MSTRLNERSAEIIRLPSAASPGLQAAPSHWDSRTLMLGQREVVIQHGDQLYRLRHTQNDKLILTK